jgi:hypothetical protein
MVFYVNPVALVVAKLVTLVMPVCSFIGVNLIILHKVLSRISVSDTSLYGMGSSFNLAYASYFFNPPAGARKEDFATGVGKGLCLILIVFLVGLF